MQNTADKHAVQATFLLESVECQQLIRMLAWQAAWDTPHEMPPAYYLAVLQSVLMMTRRGILKWRK